ncbi:hypothetical protein NKH18_02425 [Streptomyces sp. M10(2022)]
MLRSLYLLTAVHGPHERIKASTVATLPRQRATRATTRVTEVLARLDLLDDDRIDPSTRGSNAGSARCTRRSAQKPSCGSASSDTAGPAAVPARPPLSATKSTPRSRSSSTARSATAPFARSPAPTSRSGCPSARHRTTKSSRCATCSKRSGANGCCSPTPHVA